MILGARAAIAGALLAAALAVSAPGVAAQEKKEEEKPKTLFEEITWYGYVENSAVFNLRGDATKGTNELRLYDVDRGYSFNMAELSVKKDPSDRYPFGFGLVVTGGEDVQFNHAIGILRNADDAPTDWKGLVGRIEYRHDEADTPVFRSGTTKSQDTFAIALHYLFF